MATSNPSIIIRCNAKRHRVRLDTGRLWATARCPTCKTAIDPTRTRRAWAWTTAYITDPSKPGWERWMVWLVVAYLATSVVAWGLLWFAGDRWWLGTVLLFGPRWLLLVPASVLFAFAIARRRALMVPVVVSVLIVLFPVMGLTVGARSGAAEEAAPGHLRTMSFNLAGGNLHRAMWEILETFKPDIAAFQECPRAVMNQLTEIADWFSHQNGSACFMTRFPIDSVFVMERENLESVGGSGLVVRYRLQTPRGLLNVTNLHLETPREGLDPIRSGRLTLGIQKLREKTIVRDIESRRARQWVDEGGYPAIVLGDFNMPVESAIYQRHWDVLANTFSEVGAGFGATRYNGWIRARIDHVLHSPDLRAVRAFVGPDLGSDHRPLIADLEWR